MGKPNISWIGKFSLVTKCCESNLQGVLISCISVSMYKTELTWKYKYLVCVHMCYCLALYLWLSPLPRMDHSCWISGEREQFNSSDAYAAGVLKDDIVVGHLPRHLSHCLHLEYYWLHCHCMMEEDILQICHTVRTLIRSLQTTCQWQAWGINKLKHLLSHKATSVVNKSSLFL